MRSVILTCLHNSHITMFFLIYNSLKIWVFGQIFLKKTRSLAKCLIKAYFSSYSPLLIYADGLPMYLVKCLLQENLLFDNACLQTVPHLPHFELKYSVFPIPLNHLNLTIYIFIINFFRWKSCKSSWSHLISNIFLICNLCACIHWSGLSGIAGVAFASVKQWLSPALLQLSVGIHLSQQGKAPQKLNFLRQKYSCLSMIYMIEKLPEKSALAVYSMVSFWYSWYFMLALV